MSHEQICDIEADGLKPTKIHCIVCKDYNDGVLKAFIPNTLLDSDAIRELDAKLDVRIKGLDQFELFANKVSHWIGHNFLRYDAPIIRKLINYRIKPSTITDTLVQSRVQNYQGRNKHGLSAWGELLKHSKMEPPEDWSVFTPYMLEYCINDVELNYKVANYLKLEGAKQDCEEALKIEQNISIILQRMENDGFALDTDRASFLREEIKLRKARLEETILKEAPNLPKLDTQRGEWGVVSPKYKADGTLSKVGLQRYEDEYSCVAGPFSAIKWVPFDINSPRKKVQWLGPWWKPVLRTKGYRKLEDNYESGIITKENFNYEERYRWALDDINFMTIKPNAPGALRKLGDYAICKARLDEIDGWFSALGEDHRVHGSVRCPGAITHRAAHRSPNMANIPARSAYGARMRLCWTVEDLENQVLVGTDASGIQMRVLAEKIGDPEYIRTVVSGDVHTMHLEIIRGILNKPDHGTRDNAKTFIYSYVLGAGLESIAGTWGVEIEEAEEIKKQFPKRVPGLDAYLKDLHKFTKRHGYYEGLDGRHIDVKSKHYALSVVLQGDESTIMKKAMIMWIKELYKHPVDYKLVNWVHDEWQTETQKEFADFVGRIQVQAIRDTGEYFKYRTPLDGEYKIGKTWLETH